MRRNSAGLRGTLSVARGVINELVWRVSPSASSTVTDERGALDLRANRPSMTPTKPDDKTPASLPIEGEIVVGNMRTPTAKRDVSNLRNGS
jgi:hypothetical protein